jgi:hypothetical protein
VPVTHIGQQITFASEQDPDDPRPSPFWIRARKNDTIKKIAARHGHVDWAPQILKMNKGRDVRPHPPRKPGHKAPPIPKLRTITDKLRTHAAIKLPGVMKKGMYLNVHAGDKAPHIVAGYAKYDIVDVPGRVGMNRFDGYDPISMDVPVQFENYGEQIGKDIEDNIIALERMAGRGKYPGSHFGPPSVIRVSVTDNHGNVVPLIPPNYQWSKSNHTAPLWRITGIDWDDSPLRNDSGYRVRQAATITVTQYTPLVYTQHSVTARARSKKRPPHKKTTTSSSHK